MNPFTFIGVNLTRGEVAIDGLFLVLAILQVVGCIVIRGRGTASRVTLIATTAAAASSVATHALAIASYGLAQQICSTRKETTNEELGYCAFDPFGSPVFPIDGPAGHLAYIRATAGRDFMAQASDVLLLVAGLAVVDHCRMASHKLIPHRLRAPASFWKFLSMAGVLALLVLAAARGVILGLGVHFYLGNPDTTRSWVRAANVTLWMYSALYLFTISNLATSAWRQHIHAKEADVSDPLSRTLMRTYVPTFGIHGTLWGFFVVYDITQLSDIADLRGGPGVTFVRGLDRGVITFALIAILLWLFHQTHLWQPSALSKNSIPLGRYTQPFSNTNAPSAMAEEEQQPLEEPPAPVPTALSPLPRFDEAPMHGDDLPIYDRTSTNPFIAKGKEPQDTKPVLQA